MLDAAVTSWENFSCVVCSVRVLIVSKLSGVCFEVWFLFFASCLKCNFIIKLLCLTGNCIVYEFEKHNRMTNVKIK